MLPNVEHGCDFGLDVTPPGELEDPSDAVKEIWVMSVPFGFARGVAGLCILSDSLCFGVLLLSGLGGGFNDERPRLAFPVALKWRMEKVKEQH